MNIAKKVTRSSHNRTLSTKGDSTLAETRDDDDELGRYSKSVVSTLYTSDDHKDMQRMGKIQQLRRKFRLSSIICLCCMMMGTWEVLLVSNVQGLINGGLAGLFWTYIWTFVGFGFVIASLAEMASMAPTSGGQYHWVSEFAPPGYQKPLSYLVGWMSTLSWQAGQASCALITGTLVEALIRYNQRYRHLSGLYGTLCVFSTLAICFVGNIWFSRNLPGLQNILMAYHILGFFLFLAVFSAVVPQHSTAEVLSEFTNLGEWGSMPVTLMVGQVPAIWALACSDAAVHLSEETYDASIAVPRGMWWSYIINGFLGFVFLVGMLRAIPDVNGAIFNNPTPYPFLYILTAAMPSTYTWSTVFTSVHVAMGAFAGIAFTASTSRQTFAFARDNGLPFARWLSKVHPTLAVPVPAVAITTLISVAVSFINFRSGEAFDTIISLQLASLLLSHLVSIGCVLHRRLEAPHLLPRARWSLGRRGKVINSVAVAYLTFAFFWCFWPTSTSRVIVDVNWSSVIFGLCVVLILILYLVQGRRKYMPPVVLVHERRVEFL